MPSMTRSVSSRSGEMVRIISRALCVLSGHGCDAALCQDRSESVSYDDLTVNDGAMGFLEHNRGQ